MSVYRGKHLVLGANGKDGITFTPSVSDEGVLSWTNDGNLDNPQPILIKGEDGKDIKTVDCTLEEYNAMETHDPDTYYNIIDDVQDTSSILKQIGDITQLNTEEKSNLVGAINEVAGKGGDTSVINGIPVDLTGIYNTQVIGYDEESGKLVPMINVKRTIELASKVKGVWEVVEMTGFTTLRENDSNHGFVYVSGNTSGNKGTAKIKTINPYILSEFVNLYVYLWNTDSSTGICRLIFSKSPDFSTIDAQFNLAYQSNYDISNLIGKYYMMLEFENTQTQFGIQKFTLS